MIYSAITSLDGFVADDDGVFDWAAPDEEVHSFVNDLERPIGTYLYGRRMYETMRYWENPPTADLAAPAVRDYAAIWGAASKVVYSSTLPGVDTANTALEREFDPVAVEAMKQSSPADISIGGPGLAASALAAGLVDELHLFVTPVIVGSGRHFLPSRPRLRLQLVGHGRFESGVVYLRYQIIG